MRHSEAGTWNFCGGTPSTATVDLQLGDDTEGNADCELGWTLHEAD